MRADRWSVDKAHSKRYNQSIKAQNVQKTHTDDSLMREHERLDRIQVLHSVCRMPFVCARTDDSSSRFQTIPGTDRKEEKNDEEKKLDRSDDGGHHGSDDGRLRR